MDMHQVMSSHLMTIGSTPVQVGLTATLPTIALLGHGTLVAQLLRSLLSKRRRMVTQFAPNWVLRRNRKPTGRAIWLRETNVHLGSALLKKRSRVDPSPAFCRGPTIDRKSPSDVTFGVPQNKNPGFPHCFVPF